MKRNDTIGIVGHITAPPELVLDAADWARKVYETTLTRARPSGIEDTYILQFDGKAAGSEEMLLKITEGAEVLIGGEIRTQNTRDPLPEENRVKIYIYAEVITVNDPPVNDQNEVTICGHICKPPRIRTTRRRTRDGKRVVAANIIVAVNTQAGTHYIPCVCWNWDAYKANILKVGDYVEIYGRFQSRAYKKQIEGRGVPFLCTAYEVSAIDLKSNTENSKDKEQRERGRGRGQMKVQLNEVQGIYNQSRPQQPDRKKIAVVVVTRESCAAMHERAGKDMEKIVQAAGVEVLKTARIVMRWGMRQQQEAGIKELNYLLQEIRLEKDREDALMRTGIATGYANAMLHFDLMSESELKDVIEVIGQAGEKAARRIEAAKRPFWLRMIRKWVRA